MTEESGDLFSLFMSIFTLSLAHPFVTVERSWVEKKQINN